MDSPGNTNQIQDINRPTKKLVINNIVIANYIVRNFFKSITFNFTRIVVTISVLFASESVMLLELSLFSTKFRPV